MSADTATELAEVKGKIAATEAKITEAEKAGRSEAYLTELTGMLKQLYVDKNRLAALVDADAEGKGDESTEELRNALLDATIDDRTNEIRLPAGMRFPVEPSHPFAGVLLVRNAQKDVNAVFQKMLTTRQRNTMLLLGSAGIGKSWCGMYILQDLIKKGKTVVYESVQRQMTWVFRNDGKSRVIKKGPLQVADCPELELDDTIHIFDCRAGESSYPPIESQAKLLVLSSTNINSYKQVSRSALIMLFPSLTSDEFSRYAKVFNVSDSLREELKKYVGHGKVRQLYLASRDQNVNECKDEIDRQVGNFNLDLLSQYASHENNPASSQSNPAILLDAYPKEIASSSLHDKYLFSKARWQFCSNFVVEAIVRSKMNDMDAFASKLFMALGTAAREAIGVLLGRLFEDAAPHFIVKYGLSCFRIPKKSGDPAVFSIDPNLKLQICPPSKDLSYILDNYKDEKVLYFFGKNQFGFDMFNPPNNFFQFTNSIEDKTAGSHPLLISTVLKCCQLLTGKEVRFIIAVAENESYYWEKSPQSFKINDQSIVDKINNLKKSGAQPINLNGQRTFDKLPEDTKKSLSNMKQYLGLISIQKRLFSTSTFCPPRKIKPFLPRTTAHSALHKQAALQGIFARIIR